MRALYDSKSSLDDRGIKEIMAKRVSMTIGLRWNVL